MKYNLEKIRSLGFDPNDSSSFQVIPFFGSNPLNDNEPDESCLSNWFFAPVILTMGGTINHFFTVEHAMMYAKAKLFGDHKAMQRIILAQHPSVVKRIGRTVKDYDDELWEFCRYDIVKQIVLSKFQKNKILRDYLLSYPDNSIFVEASPWDKIWGVGKSTHDIITDPRPQNWLGRNQLGFILTEVFRILKGI